MGVKMKVDGRRKVREGMKQRRREKNRRKEKYFFSKMQNECRMYEGSLNKKYFMLKIIR